MKAFTILLVLPRRSIESAVELLLRSVQSILHFIRNRLPSHGLARQVSVLVGGTAIAQALAIVASPLLTRLYRPTDFGILQIFISIVGLGLVAASGRYEVAILLPENDQDSIEVLAIAIACVCITTGFAGVAVVICNYHWLLPKEMLSLRRYLWILPLSLFGAGLYQALSFWQMRKNEYGRLAKTKLLQSGAQITTQLGGGLLAQGPLGLLVGDAIGRIAGSGSFLRELWRDHAKAIRLVRARRMINLAVRYRNYPLISMWGALINSSGLALPAIFLAQQFGAQNTGWFALVNRVLGVPGALIAASISQVYAAEAAKLSRSDPNYLKEIFLKTTRHMLLLGVAPCLLFLLFAPSLFQFIFGHPWREAGEYARYMAVMFFASFVNAPVMTTLNVLERQTAQFTWDAARLALTLAAILIPGHLSCGPRTAIFAYSLSMTLMYVVHWTISYTAIDRCAARVNTSPSFS